MSCVEGPRYVPCQLQVLQLVLPHRDVGGTAGQGRPGQTALDEHTVIACAMNEVTRDLGCFKEIK